MKITITRKDLRDFILQEANIDISSSPIEIEIEGYQKISNKFSSANASKLLHEISESGAKDIFFDLDKGNNCTVITDKEGRVLDIVKDEKKDPVKKKRGGNEANLKHRPDYSDYENTILDFATSPEHKRKVPYFGAGTLSCVKERYRKIIKKLELTDMVKFSRIDSQPYLVKVEEGLKHEEIYGNK